MKILMTTDTVGGVWTYSFELCRALREHDIQITLATMGRPTGTQRREAQRLDNVELYESDYRLEWMDDPWRDVAAAGDWLLELAQQTSCDVVHLNNYAHGALPFDKPVVVVGHSCVLSWHRAVRHRAADPEWNHYRCVVTTGLRAADLVVAPTRAMLASLQQDYGPFQNSRCIWNGCNPAGFRAQELKEEFIFSAGRLWDEAKNVIGLTRAAPQLLWPVRVAGLPHPEQSADPVNIAENVAFLGRLSAAEMADVYARAAIYALPARYEPFGLTPLEAGLSGCALVLGDIDTLREVWGDAAHFVDPEDEEELADVLNRLIADSDLRRRYASAALQRAQELSADRMAADYVDVYRQLVYESTSTAV